jgi:alkylhydroperoxidase family enzyme
VRAAACRPVGRRFRAVVQAWLDRTMPPGVPPLVLFTTLARDPRLFQRFMGGGLLDRGNLTMRQRELVILRITARCGSEYEWGVHVALFGARVGVTPEQHASLVRGGPDDACWSDAERVLLRVCDELDTTADLGDATWAAARADLSEPAVVEVVMLCGFYRTVAYLTCALRLPLERFAPRFSSAGA